MQRMIPTAPREREAERTRSRRILGWLTGLLVLGLVTAALWPVPPRPGRTEPGPGAPDAAGGPSQADPVAASGPAEPNTPPATKPDPPKPEEPPPTPSEPLPDRPETAPSHLVVHGDRSCPQIALTYDAGSEAAGAAAILDALKKHKVISTFFLTGKWVERYPDLARRIAADGHEIANHTYSHPDLTKTPAEAVIKEINDGEEAIRRITGRETRPLFREPYGAFNEEEQRLVRQAGYSYSVYWENDTLDWQFPGVETVVARITQRSKNGSIVLMHLNSVETAEASDLAIPILKEKGYRLVTVTEVLRCK